VHLPPDQLAPSTTFIGIYESSRWYFPQQPRDVNRFAANDDGDVDGLKHARIDGITRKAYGDDLDPSLPVQSRQHSDALGFICNACRVMEMSLGKTA
jgi:hypothetical protein